VTRSAGRLATRLLAREHTSDVEVRPLVLSTTVLQWAGVFPERFSDHESCGSPAGIP